jgi:transcriptional regulator with PAS, ATPase and Fis domain
MALAPLTLTLARHAGRDAVEIPGLVLVVRSPGAAERVEPIRLGAIVIGSSAEADIRLADGGVSRAHCELRLGPEGVVVRDLGSKNGTAIAGVRVREAILPAGATLSLGSSSVTLEERGAPTVLPLSEAPRFGDALGGSVAMRALFAELARAAASPIPILLLGESGTGKDLLAQAIHAASPRRDGPFVVVDCGAVAPSLIEAELFGYVKGAFTGAAAARKGLLEEADGGTLFLDEIGELPLDLQPRLLRALDMGRIRPLGASEWRSAEARVVAATHNDLRARVSSGAFRQDLYYRLAGLQARLPPLRERKEDIPLLVEHFLARAQPPRKLDDLPPGTIDLLVSHDWPGNVRELRNAVARLVLFPERAERALLPGGADPAAAEDADLRVDLPLREARDEAVAAFERRYLIAVLKKHGWNVTAAAQAMGVSRQFAHKLLARYDIRHGDES